MQMPTTKQNHHQSNNSVSYTQPILEALLILLIVVGWPLAVHYELFYSVFGLRVLDNALRESLIVQKAAVFGGAQSVASLCQFKAASMEHPSVEGETLFMMKLYANSSICMDHFNNDKTYCDEQVARIARFRARHTVTQLKADLKESAVLSNRACATLVAMAVRDVALRFTDQWLLSNLAWLPRPLNPVSGATRTGVAV
jgi:hypothetical protein